MSSSKPWFKNVLSFSQREKSPEVRCAVRFPLNLTVVLKTGQEEFSATTENVSASGIYLLTDRPVSAGSQIAFSMRMPGAVLGTPNDVLVHCRGRVVRCTSDNNGFHVAATIDEYTFAEH